MAQIGSFVPAEYAKISVVDKIFTRIGASDDLTAGQSTFMVEMKEVSDILNYATKNSLVILDEVGRGTSTLDGVSIARAVAEYISSRKIGCKTLFATHYHELLDLEQEMQRSTRLPYCSCILLPSSLASATSTAIMHFGGKSAAAGCSGSMN